MEDIVTIVYPTIIVTKACIMVLPASPASDLRIIYSASVLSVRQSVRPIVRSVHTMRKIIRRITNYKLSFYYHPRSGCGNNFGRVYLSICLSVRR